jgi:integrase
VQVYTGTCHTRKRALSKDEICRLSALGSENALSPALYRTQQYFLFGFHACGMSFIDLAFLRKSDLSDGHISYRRIKTGLLIPVKITRPMQEIIDYFAPAVSHSPYAFPIIDPAKGNERLQYETALRNQNRRLKTLCRLAGIEKNISTHVARHSWATVAKKENIVTTVISDCLGHCDEKTTAIYLDSFDITVTDMASELVSAVISGTDIPREAGRMLFRNENMPDYRAYKKRKVPSKKCPFLHK